MSFPSQKSKKGTKLTQKNYSQRKTLVLKQGNPRTDVHDITISCLSDSNLN